MMSASTNGSTHRLTDDAAALPGRSAVSGTVPLGPEAHSAVDTAGLNRQPDVESNPESTSESTSDSWRVEVAARLERYRTRRKPRTPRYPSLLLPFDAPESWSRPTPPQSEQDFEVQILDVSPYLNAPAASAASAAPELTRHSYSELPLEPSAKVLEFPRSAAIPVFHASELADPIFDRPRIVEAPEVLPPPPALGGMTIEAADREPADRRVGVDFPAASSSASIPRRALATLVDGIVLGPGLAAFAAIFLRLNPVRGPLPLLAGAFVAVGILLWAIYEFLFVVYTGSTPGLRAARLRLTSFDGSYLNRRRRRWRVLASFLSAFSVGLGYLWCVLDQDGLCWHDRITRTHVQSAPRTDSASSAITCTTISATTSVR
jgi:uncharacterized RDD family membrane protein YckC